MLWALQCMHVASSCMSLTHACKPDLLPDIFDLSIMWPSAYHWYVRNIASNALEPLVGERERGREVAECYRSTAQRSVSRRRVLTRPLYLNGTDNENVPVHLISILRFFYTPNLVFGGARNLVPPSKMVPVNIWHSIAEVLPRQTRASSNLALYLCPGI